MQNLVRRLSPDPGRDLIASLVVFLVALPLCMGIAIASGLPPEKGLITGVVGGLVVGFIAGSPLQVSGPAAGLAVIVLDLVSTHGVGLLGPILLLAGLIQLAAGLGGLGRYFRAISPAVIYGMLAGIGVLIAVAQVHVMMDGEPEAEGLANILALPGAVFGRLLPLDGGPEEAALALGVLTLVVMLAWDAWKPGRLRHLPGALLGVAAATLFALVLRPDVAYVDVPGNILTAFDVPGLADLAGLASGGVLVTAVAVAFIASAETLLSAAAVDQMQTGPRGNFDRELASQGVGNMICGAVGALPMTGVIVRSSANVQAGAVSRLSAILHGLWIAVFVAALPFVLNAVPTASLAAVLVLIGCKLVDVGKVRKLAAYGRMPLAVYAVTLLTILATDLLIGVLVGLALSLAEILTKTARLRLDVARRQEGVVDLDMKGAATFLHTPKLTAVLDDLPAGTTLRVRTEDLTCMDHGARETLAAWERQNAGRGSRLAMDEAAGPTPGIERGPAPAAG